MGRRTCDQQGCSGRRWFRVAAKHGGPDASAKLSRRFLHIRDEIIPFLLLLNARKNHLRAFDEPMRLASRSRSETGETGAQRDRFLGAASHLLMVSSSHFTPLSFTAYDRVSLSNSNSQEPPWCGTALLSRTPRPRAGKPKAINRSRVSPEYAVPATRRGVVVAFGQSCLGRRVNPQVRPLLVRSAGLNGMAGSTFRFKNLRTLRSHGLGSWEAARASKKTSYRGQRAAFNFVTILTIRVLCRRCNDIGCGDTCRPRNIGNF